MDAKNKDIILPSGAKLHITISPFAIGRELYQAVLAEAKDLKFDPKAEVDVNFRKDLVCLALSSKRIEACLEACFARCSYNGVKITSETFEPIDAREDYIPVMWEVGKENLLPFMKGLSAGFGTLFTSLAKDLA